MEKVYTAEDHGLCHTLDNHVPKELHLKINAPVILTVNLSDELVNGLRGRVIALDESGPTVYFQQAEATIITKPHTFTVFSKAQFKDIGYRKQVPLNLAFALTVHKAQGMSLDRVTIDCRNMQNPGQIGVAIGRATSKKGLRVLNFEMSLLRPHPQSVTEWYSRIPTEPLADLTCCPKNTEITHDPLKLADSQDACVTPIYSTTNSDIEEPLINDLIIPSENEIDKLIEEEGSVSLFTEDSNVEDVLVLQEEICTKDLICGISHDTVETEQQQKENELCHYLQEHSVCTEDFLKKIWQNEVDNFKDVLEKDSVQLCDLKKYYEFNFHYLSSDEYISSIEKLFGQKPKREHANICFKLARGLREEFLRLKVKPIIDSDKNQASKDSSHNYRQSDAGRGTLRYIGSWCVATTKYNKKQSIRRNLYKSAKAELVERLDLDVKYLDKLVTNYHEIVASTSDPASLEETKRRQNAIGSLTNITDLAFNFFTNLDKTIRSLETRENINLHGTDFYTYISQQILEDKVLLKQWQDMFKENSLAPSVQSLNPVLSKLLSTQISSTSVDTIPQASPIDSLYNEICSKYLRMSSGQYRKQFLREIKTEKQEAHRKQIRMRKAKKGQDKIIFGFDFIISDITDSKIASHRRLQAEVEYDDSYLENKFTKTELTRLCEAYQVKYVKSATKKNINRALNVKLLETVTIPRPEYLNMIPITVSTDADNSSMSELPETSKESEELNDASVSHVDDRQNANNSNEEQGPSTRPESKSCGKGKRKGKEKGKGKAKSMKKIEYPCGVCFMECYDNCIACEETSCETWYHFDCIGLTDDDLKMLEGKEWHCDNCRTEN